MDISTRVRLRQMSIQTKQLLLDYLKLASDSTDETTRDTLLAMAQQLHNNMVTIGSLLMRGESNDDGPKVSI